MPTIHVCSLAKIADFVDSTGARSLITLISAQTLVPRPDKIEAKDHLHVTMSDIVTPMDGQILPDDTHIDELLRFVRAWDRKTPVLIHCYAGVSRSTAAAFIAACALNPERSETDIAQAIRARSPTATPNARMIELADDKLGRAGRMVAAIRRIGRGEDCFEGVPFQLELQ